MSLTRYNLFYLHAFRCLEEYTEKISIAAYIREANFSPVKAWLGCSATVFVGPDLSNSVWGRGFTRVGEMQKIW